MTAPRRRPGGRRRAAAWMAAVAMGLAAALVAAGCSGSSSGRGAGSATTAGSAGPATTAGSAGPATTAATGLASPDLAAVKLTLAEVGNLDQPLALAVRPGDDGLYVALKGGPVRRVAHGQGGGTESVEADPVLDLTGQVSTGSEQGLLGLTFSPDGATLYADYTDRAGDTQVVAYPMAGTRADAASRRTVLTLHQPYTNHNGGEVAFGPDGKLYVGLGDGGSEEDPDHVGQNRSTLLAKILRIDPAPSAGKGYTVPADNPLVGTAGFAPETYEWGLRNPWRFTWDRDTKDLWIGDVGQNTWEEIDFRAAGSPAGANFGWSGMEASHPFHGGNPPGGVLPLTEYRHTGGNCSVTGGYVYRGTRIALLRGVYLYGDYCSGTVWGLVQTGGKVAGSRQLNVGGSHRIQSFGEDALGELYLLATDGLFRIQAA
ncbi:MAG: sorbosone dehydrogenase family protein [Acidimicrobiales bacterium]